MKYHYFVSVEHETTSGQPHRFRAEIATKNKILHFNQIIELEKRLKNRIYRNKKIKVSKLIILNYILMRKEPTI